MAYTVVKLPSSDLGVKKEVDFDPELTGADHELLLSSTPTMFERNMVSVVSGKVRNGETRWLSTPDALYLFFLARSHTLGAIYTAPWTCSAPIRKGKVESPCGQVNTFELDIGKLDIRFAEGYKLPRYPVEIALDPADPETKISTEVWARLLSCVDDLEAIEVYYEQGYDRKSLAEDSAMAYQYAKERLAIALSFGDDRLRDLTTDQKVELLRGFKYSLVDSLLADQRKLDTLGVDLSPRECECKKCKAKVKVAIPFTGSFLLSHKQ
jgi:hypothetical protein